MSCVKRCQGVEQSSAASTHDLAHRYVMAQVGMVKPDTDLLQLHGKIDNMLMRRAQYHDARINSLLDTTDAFKPNTLKAIDIQVYGAPHTQIGLSLTKSAGTNLSKVPQNGWALAVALLSMAVAIVGLVAAVALLLLWRPMAARLRWLQWFVAIN